MKHHLSFNAPLPRTVFHVTQGNSFLAQKIWGLMPDNLKILGNGEVFKQNIRKRKLDNCPCSLC